MNMRTLITGGTALYEAPIFASDRRYYFSDARGGGLYVLDPATGTADVALPHRKGIGGIAEHVSGGFVISGRNVAVKSVDGSVDVVLAEKDEAIAPGGFNDLVADSHGRIYVGTLGEVALDGRIHETERRRGGVAVIDLDGSVRLVADGVGLANGGAFSPDGRTYYVSDSADTAVLAFDADPATGNLSGRRVFARPERGVPDGMAMASDGTLLVALTFSGSIGRFDPSGRQVATIDVPVPDPTSLCFGGEHLDELLITCAANRGARTAAVLSIDADVAGQPLPLARVPSTGR
jgi:xylono-1,5-lactonase